VTKTACLLILASIVACESAKKKPPAPAPAPPPSHPAVAVVPADAAIDAPPAPPAPVARTEKQWPFHRWDHAEAVLFNQFQERMAPLFAYDEHGWNPSVVERKPLDQTLAKEAFALVVETEGEHEVSKCPFPRHGVVFFDGEVPVASINVCFQCGDILAWPLWDPEPDYDHLTPKQERALDRRYAWKNKRYATAFPKWKTFFHDKIGFEVDPAKFQ
jgi:hypothetical protein